MLKKIKGKRHTQKKKERKKAGKNGADR